MPKESKIMSDTPQPSPSHAEQFAGMVMQITNTAMVFLGAAPHPETGERVKDLQLAGLFIGQLEMLEMKTRGNLDAREAALLKQSLMAARMAFVEAAEGGKIAAAPAPAPQPVESTKALEEIGRAHV